MIYVTGDTHRDKNDFIRILDFCRLHRTTKADFMIIAGDVGVNYYMDRSDTAIKDWLECFPVTFLMIRGNHEERPENIPEYRLKHIKRGNFEGNVFADTDHPSLLFADNGPIRIEDKAFYVINGAYSIDKYSRLAYGMKWFSDEELHDWEMDKIRYQIARIGHVDVVLSHTCPAKYIPHERYLPKNDPASISWRMEDFLDEVEENLEYEAWYCGHWHIEAREDRMFFVYHDIHAI